MLVVFQLVVPMIILFFEKAYAVHQLERFRSVFIKRFHQVIHPNVALAADVYEQIRIRNFENVLWRRLVGMHLRARTNQHSNVCIIPDHRAHEIVARKARYDNCRRFLSNSCARNH